MFKKIIEIRNLNYFYPDGRQALCNINLDIFEGECIGVIGPNGAGKSTLLLHLNGILMGSGYIRIGELEMNDKNLSQIRKKVGLVFQEPDNQLFMPTVFDDVAFGPINLLFSEEELRSAVNDALRQVDMLDAVNRQSHHLSFGEKKRISIATVLSMKPQILALDEPSSNLDLKHRRNLIKLLNQLKHTKIIVTHDLDLVFETCSRIILIDQGKLIATGNVLDILQDGHLLQSHNLEIPYSVLYRKMALSEHKFKSLPIENSPAPDITQLL